MFCASRDERGNGEVYVFITILAILVTIVVIVIGVVAPNRQLDAMTERFRAAGPDTVVLCGRSELRHWEFFPEERIIIDTDTRKAWHVSLCRVLSKKEAVVSRSH